MRTCIVCGNGFTTTGRGRGHVVTCSPPCREIRRKRTRSAYEASGASAEGRRKWRLKNRKKMRKWYAEYRTRNRERCLQSHRRWQAKNRERLRAYQRRKRTEASIALRIVKEMMEGSHVH